MPTPLPATLAQALAQAAASGLPRPEAHMLLLHALGRPAHERAWLLAHDSDALPAEQARDRKSTRLNSSHLLISYAVFCLKKKRE